MQILAYSVWAQQRRPARQGGCVSHRPTRRRGGTEWKWGADRRRSWWRTGNNGGLLKFHFAIFRLGVRGLNTPHFLYNGCGLCVTLRVQTHNSAFKSSCKTFNYHPSIPPCEVLLYYFQQCACQRLRIAIGIFNIQYYLSFHQQRMNKVSVQLWELISHHGLVLNSISHCWQMTKAFAKVQ